jgi:DNA-binding GntR family transcriptional regulator
MSRTDSVLGVLSEAIADGRLVPGSLHSAQSLALQLGVSRTPVREALLQLARDGTVRFERNRGVRIVQNSEQDLRDMYQMREWLEVPAAALAAAWRTEKQLEEMQLALDGMVLAAKQHDLSAFGRHDRRFHRVFLEASGNARVAPYVATLRELLLRREAVTVNRGRDPMEVVVEHRLIIAAIAARDAGAAAAAVHAHLQRAIELLVGGTEDPVEDTPA